MEPPPIRAVTVGIAEAHPLSAAALRGAAESASRSAAQYRAAGYEVQSVRLSTRPLFVDLPDQPTSELVSYAAGLDALVGGLAPDVIVSIGPAPAHRPDFDLDRLAVIADLLVAAPSLYATVQLATAADGIRTAAAEPCGEIVRRLARETDEGFGNFRFAVLACVAPGSPFFPAGYHQGSASLAVGWQGAGVVATAVAEAAADRGGDLSAISERIRDAVVEAATPIIAIGQRAATELELRFGGLDVSPAPAGDDSIGRALESFGYGPVGSPGTLAAAATITTALKATGLPTCGYSGLMLPVMEDAVLAERWAAGGLALDRVLAYSAICGTGLDTIPLPGDVSAQELGAIYLDVAALAVRLDKPLSARLLPVPGLSRGDPTTFSSPYLVNTRI